MIFHDVLRRLTRDGAASVVFTFVLGCVLTGCGYTSKIVIPEGVKTVHVMPMKNMIDLSKEATQEQRFRVYRPGIEVDMTNAVINRFMFDGHLKVSSKEKADAIFESQLMDYRRDALRYSDQDEIQEYRLSVIIQYTLTKVKDGKLIMQQTVGGDTSYFLSGAHAITEDEAMAKAIEDTARRVVESVVELW